MSPHPIRPATLEDVPAIRRILAAHGNDGPVTEVDVVGPYVRHLVTAPHARALVTTDGDDVVAFGAAIDAGIAAHLSDLFVAPDRLGQGIGRPLLEAVLEGAADRTTFASADPRALPLYVRAGMRPYWTVYFLTGRADTLPTTPSGLSVVAADPVGLADLEAAWTGAGRRADHDHWASLPGATPLIVRDGGEAVAFAHARRRQAADVRTIDRMLVRDGADPVACLLAVLPVAALGRPVGLALPGPHAAFRLLLEAGFRVEDHDQFMASDPGLVDPTRRLPDGGML